jgi:hypothetical protein
LKFRSSSKHKSHSRSRSRRKHTERKKSKSNEIRKKSIEIEKPKDEKSKKEILKDDKEKNKIIKPPQQEKNKIELNNSNKENSLFKSKENENPNDIKNLPPQEIEYRFKYEPHLAKFYEEFINLKKFEEDPKAKLPKLIDKDKDNLHYTGTISNNIDNRYGLKGLRHEREDFINYSKTERNQSYKYGGYIKSSRDFRGKHYNSYTSQRKNSYRKK